jgi:biopolymer transport protein ExbD
MTTLVRSFALTVLTACFAGSALAAEDGGGSPANAVQYKRADAKFYARGDVLKANPDALILPTTAFAQNGDIYTYTPTKKVPKFVYVEAPNDWVEPITPPDMPASLNIAPDAMQVREPHGDVQVAMPNAPTNFTPAADGEPLPDGAVIKTGANSTAAILFGGVASARLMPNSEAAVQQAVASTSRAVEVDLTTGGVFAKVGTQVGVSNQFQVHTRNGTAQAAAGDFATFTTADRTDVWVSQGALELLAPDGKKFGSVTADGTGPLKLIRYPAIASQAQSQQADAESLTAIMNFIPMANQKLAALHQKSAAGVPLSANEQAYLQRIKQVPALLKLELIAPPPAELAVLADGTVSFQGATLSLVELGPKLKDYVATAYQPVINVKAGTGATYAGFTAALDACKAATGLKYKVVGETPAKPAPPPPPPAPPKPIEGVVQSDGTVKVDGVKLTSDAFIAKVKAAVAATPAPPVTLRADPKASYAALATIIAAGKAAAPNNFNVELPPATELTVAVHGDGTILFHGATESIDDFRADITAAVQLHPDLPVVVHSNPKADYAKFTAVVDACKTAQAKQVTLVPPTPQPPPPPKTDALVQADGSIKFQGAALNLADFTAQIKAAVAGTPDAPVTLHADPKANYAAVAAAADACKNAPAKNFNLALPPAKELTVTVHGDGSILFHGATQNLDAFSDDIKAAVALRPDAPIVIHSNPKADYAKFQAVVDASKATGAKEVNLIQPTPQPPKPVVAATPALPPTAETPPTPAPKPVAPAEPLPVIAHADGTIKFQGKTMKIDEFTAKIKAAATANPDLAVIIHSNPKMDFAKFQAVVDACKNAPAKEVDVVPPAPQPPAVAATPALPPTAETPPTPAPTPTPTAPAKPLEPATVLVHSDGSVGFLGKRGTLDDFKKKLAEVMAATPARQIVVKTSGPKVSNDKVQAVLDACKAANVTNLTAPVASAAAPLPVTAETPPATNAPSMFPPAAPEQTPAPPEVNTKPVPAEIDLAADGSLTLDGSAVTEDELKGALTTLKKSNPKNPLVMMKQPGVTKDQWMHYVNLCHSLGLKLLVKDAKATAAAPITPKVEAPAALRPSAAEGGPAVQAPPAPESAPATNAPTTISATEEAVPVEIELTPDGQVSFFGEAVTDDELKTRLGNVAQNNAKEQVLIVKDEKVSHDQLQHVIDLCHAAKLKVKVKTVKSSDMGALKPHAQLPVALEPPPAAGGERELPVEIGLSTKGRITFEGNTVSLDQLKDRLATVAKGNPNQPVVIVRASDVPDDSVDALVTVCQGVNSQLKISVRSAPAFTPPALPDNSPADNLPAPDAHAPAAG